MADDLKPTGPDLAKGIALSDIPEGDILTGHVGDKPVLLSRFGGEVYAVSGSCTHYHAPLGEGLVRAGRVHCPWHHACFDLKSGEAVRAPAFDALERYAVTVENDLVTVGDALESTSPKALQKDAPKRIVIIGGGAAGFAAAEMLRRRGFAGSLTILSAEADPPVDRPNLSKDYLAGSAPADWIPLRPDAFYKDKKIDLRTGCQVTNVDAEAKTTSLSGGESLGYDKLLLATGGEPVRLPTPGFDKPNVYVLRSLDQSTAIVEAAKTAKTAAVIGASFIGLEVAAALTQQGLKVHVVAPEQLPLVKVLGPELGAFVKGLHDKKGVTFHLETEAKSFDGKTLSLSDGHTIAVDFVVQGVGVKPRLDLAKALGLKTDKGVLVDAHFQTSLDGVYAAGDIAQYPDPVTGGTTRIEHWVAAERQGQIAAVNMLGETATLDMAPFFWSQHYDAVINYVGHAADWDKTTIEGSVEKGDCIVRYYKDGKLLAAASNGRDLENLKVEAELEGV